MDRGEVWKNFDLGTELDVSGAFIYNGLRCFHEMKSLDRPAEIFEFLYNVAVGLERLLKIAVILLEHDGTQDQRAFERSLITHNHLELVRRLKVHTKIAIAGPHNELLGLLGSFYKTLRYDRYVLSDSWNPDKEKAALWRFLEKHLEVTIEDAPSHLSSQNCDRFRKHIGRLVGRISGELYRIIREKATSINLYTFEVRADSKAAKVFHKQDCNFLNEDILWKELLIFFMNTKATSGLLTFLRSIEPLEFDEGCGADYLQCFQSEEGKQYVIGELEELYSELNDVRQRQQLIGALGTAASFFDILADPVEWPCEDAGADDDIESCRGPSEEP
jgi:hypothetical protein